MPGFQCGTCGKQHDHLPRDIGFRRPDAYFNVPEGQRERRVLIDDDLCIIDEMTFFLRGVLYLPFQNGAGQFGWGIWATVSPDDFRAYVAAWHDDAEDHLPPFPGQIASALGPYPDSLGLSVTIQALSGGERPRLTVVSAEHPLGLDQRAGISDEKAHSFVEQWT